MKRIYLTLVVLLAFIAMPAQAQFKWGVKGGANVANVHFKDLPSELKSKTSAASTSAQRQNGRYR